MSWYASLTVASLIASALAIPAGHVLHGKRAVANHLERRRVDGDAIIPVRIALKQSNLETGYDRLMEVSHPESARYGKHFTAEEVAEMFAPAQDSIDTVKNWLMGFGFGEEDIMHYTNKNWLAIDMPASKAEELFATEYHEHEFSDRSMRIGCDEYYLPAHVAPHVDLIKPGVVMSNRMKKRSLTKRQWGNWPPNHKGPHTMSWPHGWPSHTSTPISGPTSTSSASGPTSTGIPAGLQNCDTHITPPCLRYLYQIPAHPNNTSPENVMGLYESGDYFAQEDLDLFFAKFLPYIPQGTTPKVDSVDGGHAPVPVHDKYNTGESDTDLELAYSLIYPQTVTVYQVDDIPNATGHTNATGFLNDFLDAVDGSYCNYTAFGITGNSPKIDPHYPDPRKGGYKGQLMCGTYQLTRVVSISYGDPEAYFPQNYLQRQCSEIMKLGMQGHSILDAAGDYGVASFPGTSGNAYGCLPAPGSNTTFTVYNPDWPSSCPYMTAVGGSQINPGQNVNDRESAMQVNLTAFNIATGEGAPEIELQYFASGGGFSNFFPQPAYQQAAVQNYINSNTLPPSYAANAEGTNIGEGGGLWNRLGRAYPDVAANGAYLDIFNNGTEERIFGTSLASPIFASVLTLLNQDRTEAGKGPIGFVNPVLYANPWVLNDIINGSNPNCNSSGFHATVGWDPVTGLGTPNYPKMRELFLSLP